MTHSSPDQARSRPRSLYVVATATLLLASSVAWTQEHVPRRLGHTSTRMAKDEFFVESIILPPDSGRLSRLIVHVRLRPEFLVFVRSRAVAPDSAYFGGAQLTFNITDNDGMSLGSRTISRRKFISEQEKRTGAIADVLMREVFDLAPGRYTVMCELSVLESQKEFRFPIGVHVRDVHPPAPYCVAFFPVSGTSPDGVEAVGVGGGIRYTQRSLLIVQIKGDTSARCFASIRSRYSNDEPFVDMPVQPIRRRTGIVLTPVHGSESFRYRFMDSDDPSDQVWELDLRLDTLQFGPYRLRILARLKDAEDTLIGEFPVIWEDMPHPLRDVDNAIASMRYILTDDQLEMMGAGEPADRWNAFFEYWRRNDPTPSNVWNEKMVEYFRRVATAFDAYRSIRYANGVFTDRGRIHILYGAAEKIERRLLPDGLPTEIWYYPSLGKKFIFTDRGRNGGYELREKGDM